MFKPFHSSFFRNAGKKIFWLFAGLMVGVGISSAFADSRTPSSYEFKVLAVSEEDAVDKASEMLRTGAFQGAFSTEKLLAASMPECEERGSAFQCETHLVYRE